MYLHPFHGEARLVRISTLFMNIYIHFVTIFIRSFDLVSILVVKNVCFRSPIGIAIHSNVTLVKLKLAIYDLDDVVKCVLRKDQTPPVVKA